MKREKTILLAILLGCYISSEAMARTPSLRTAKNLFVEHSSGLKQLGLSAIAVGVLATACALTSAGCGPSRAWLPSPSRHDHEGHRASVWQGGVLWHSHAERAWEQHGWGRFRGLLDTNVSTYRRKFHYLTSDAYHGVAVLVEDEGVYKYGLASRNHLSDDMITLLISYSNRHQTVSINKIVGVPYMHGGRSRYTVSKQDVHPYEFGNYSSDASVLEDGLNYEGVSLVNFTNGMRVIKLDAGETVLVDK